LSFGNLNKTFGTIQEALIIALIVIIVLTFYLNIDLSYKVNIVIFVFAIFILVTLANGILQMQKEMKKQEISRS